MKAGNRISKKLLAAVLLSVCAALAAPQTARSVTLTGGAALTESASVNNDFLGQSVEVSGDRMIAGAPGRPSYRPGSGYALIFDRNSTGTWSRAVKLTPDDGANGDEFGRAVSVSGDRAIVGAPRKGNWTGAAYIFERGSDGTWSQVAKFTAEAASDEFGLSVSISGDRAIVGAPDGESRAGAAYVYKRNSSGTWSREAKLTASDGAFIDEFGHSVALAGTRAIVGAPRDNPSGINGSTHQAGSAYIFEISSGSWTQHRKLTASDKERKDYFGYSVALSSDGRAIVGARGENGSRGAAYVFVRNPNGDYAQTAKLTASDRTANDEFGWSVSISGDGDVAIVGTKTAGKAYVFTRDSVRFWRQTQRISAGNWFGRGVSISNDRAAVGAPWYNSARGAAYVYNLATVPNPLPTPPPPTRDGNQGSNQDANQGSGQDGNQGSNQDANQGNGQGGNQGSNQDANQDANQGSGQGAIPEPTGSDATHALSSQARKLTARTETESGRVGASVSVSGDRMITGAPGLVNGQSPGYAYVYERSASGVWVERARLSASDGAARDQFGHSVAISGSRAVVGAYRDDSRRGAAYVFERNSSGTWTQAAKLTASDGARTEEFGYSVAMSGSRVVVGSPRHDLPGKFVAGAVYVFDRSSSGAWSQTAKLTAGDGSGFDKFGWSVAISDSRVIAGAHHEESNTYNSGAAYIFARSSTGIWTQTAKLSAADPGRSDEFGWSVAISGSRAVVGAHNDFVDGRSRAGSAYVFDRNSSGAWSQTAKLSAGGEREANARFGWSVAVVGGTALVGMPGDGSVSEAAYVFDRNSSGAWSQTRKLTPTGDGDGGTTRGDGFGQSVALSSEGRAAVGAPHDDGRRNNVIWAGSVYLYGTGTDASPAPGSGGGENPAPGEGETGTGDTTVGGGNPEPGEGEDTPDPPADPAVEAAWNEILNNLNAAAAASSVAVSSDTAIVGSESDGNAQDGELSGSALIFERDSDGAWSQAQKLTASDAEARGLFGTSVAVSGSRAVIGAVGDDTNGQLAGAVYIFDKGASGTWSQTAKLVAGDGSSLDFLGRSVSVSGDTAIAGADGYNEGESVTGAAYVFRRDSDGTWTQTQLLASDGEHGDSFGTSVSMSEGRAVVGAPRVGDNGQNSGAAYIFERDSDGAWTQVQKLTAGDDAEVGDSFGASVSMSEGRAVVGAPRVGDNGQNSGAAYIFERDSDGAWTQVQKLTAGDDAEVGDRFGESVSISRDRVVVGVNDADSAYVYKRDSDGAWALEEKLAPAAPAADYFGDAVAVSGNRVILTSSRNTASIYEISSDDTAPRPDPEEGPAARVSETVTLPGSGKLTAGDGAAGDLFGRSASVSGARAIVGATGDRNNGVITGSAYVFEKGAEGSWTQVQKLLASDGAANDGFGISVAISGNRAIAGALNADGDATDPGAAYVFERGSSGAWTQVQKFTAGDAADNDTFGASVSMSGDRAIIGNTNDDDNGSNSGSAYVFDRNSEGTWSQSAKLLASGGASLDEFGASVSISEDRAVVSAIGDDDNGSNSGSAYVFDRNSEGAWSQSAKLTPEDGTAAHSFGISVSVSGDIAVVGADGDGDNGTRAGAAYVFERSTDDGTWAEVSKLTASDAEARDTFGRYVSVSGNRIVVGAEINGDNGAASGSAYVFERNSDGSWSETTKLLAGDGAAGDLFGGSVAISGDTAVIAAPGDDTGRGSVYVYEPSTSAPSGPGAGPDSGQGQGGVDERSAREAARLSIATGGNRQSALSSGSGGCALSSLGSGGALTAALALMLIPAFAGFGKRKRT